MKIINFKTQIIHEVVHPVPNKEESSNFLLKKLPKDVQANPMQARKQDLTFKAILIKSKEGIVRTIHAFSRKIKHHAPDMGMAKPAETTLSTSTTDAPHMEYRSLASKIMLSGDSFPEMSRQMNAFVQKAAPESFKKLQALIDQNPEVLQQLKEKGWEGMKKELKEGMAKNDPIRCACVEQVIDLLMETMRAMGFDPPGNHSASGTPGWNSDIDSPFFAPKEMPHTIQVLEKSMFDLVIFANFGGLPGFIFDTETYTQQAGGKFETQLHLESRVGEILFARIELTASLLQKLIQTGGMGTEAWETFKEEQLAAAQAFHNKSYESALSESFSDLESLHQEIRQGIQERMQSENLDPKKPQSPHLALMGYKMEGIYEISREIDANMQLLDKLLQKDRPGDAEKRDLLRVKIAQLEVVRTSFYDEGYLTQGAFRKVCFLHEGQMHQRKIEAQQNKIRHHYRMQQENLTSPKEIVPWTGGYRLHKTQQKLATAQENFSSMTENLAMGLGHFAQKAGSEEGESWQKALLETSKYSERVMQSIDNLVQMIESNPSLPPDQLEKIQKIKKKIEELSFIVSEQEKVKRANILNYVSTERELLKALQVDKMDNKGQKKLKTILKTILEVSERRGIIGQAKFEADLLPEDRYLVLYSKMVDQGLISDIGMDPKGLPYSNNPQVDLILKARSGFTPAQDSDLYRQLLPYHQRSIRTTLKAQKLKSPAAIADFYQKLTKVVNEVANLSLVSGVVPSPLAVLPLEFKFSQTWRF